MPLFKAPYICVWNGCKKTFPSEKERARHVGKCDKRLLLEKSPVANPNRTKNK